jgi:hypothetical protein
LLVREQANCTIEHAALESFNVNLNYALAGDWETIQRNTPHFNGVESVFITADYAIGRILTYQHSNRTVNWPSSCGNYGYTIPDQVQGDIPNKTIVGFGHGFNCEGFRAANLRCQDRPRPSICSNINKLHLGCDHVKKKSHLIKFMQTTVNVSRDACFSAPRVQL